MIKIVEKANGNIAITGICERFTSSNNNLVICSSNEQESINGVAIIIQKKRIKGTVSGYEAVSDRIVVIRIQAKPVNFNFVQTYALTLSATLQAIEELYGKLAETIDKIPN